jgi:hypothetical protein
LQERWGVESERKQLKWVRIYGMELNNARISMEKDIYGLLQKWRDDK